MDDGSFFIMLLRVNDMIVAGTTNDNVVASEALLFEEFDV